MVSKSTNIILPKLYFFLCAQFKNLILEKKNILFGLTLITLLARYPHRCFTFFKNNQYFVGRQKPQLSTEGVQQHQQQSRIFTNNVMSVRES